MSTIAIIGSGNVGRALAGSAVRAGHEVIIASNDPDHARVAAAETGARAVDTAVAAASLADIVILAIPATSLAAVADQLRGTVAGRIVVDVTNKPTPDLQDLASDPISNAERLQALLPEAHVVKAFNTAFASKMADPHVGDVTADGFVAADDAEAKNAVTALVDQLGFRPVDAGPLANARALEALAWLNIFINMTQNGSWQTAWKLVEPTRAAA